jgi:hypothetical protein
MELSWKNSQKKNGKKHQKEGKKIAVKRADLATNPFTY